MRRHRSSRDRAKGTDWTSGGRTPPGECATSGKGRAIFVTDIAIPSTFPFQPPVRVRCAICQAESPQAASDPGALPDEAPDCDTRPAEPMRQTIQAWLMECPQCGYVAHDLAVQDPNAAELMRSGRYQKLRMQSRYAPLANRFRRFSLLLETIGSFADAGWSALHAAWASDDAGDAASARECRLEAIRLWKHGKTHQQDFGDSTGLEFAIVVDVLRRAGEWEEARESALSAMSMDDLPELLDDLFRFQLVLVQRKDDARHHLAELPQKKGTRVVLD